MSLPQCQIKLNDYAVILSDGQLVVDGPDKNTSRRIGEAFLDLIQTQYGFSLVAMIASFAEAEEMDAWHAELIDRLNVPRGQRV